MNDSKYPHVSFIIPTLNAEKILARCLQAIRSQNYPRKYIEIIIADGGSTDQTREIAKKFNAKIIENPEILHEHGKSLGSRVAQGELLFFTDADNVLSHSTWLKSMVKPYMDNKKIRGLLPQTIPAPDSNNLDRYLGYLFTDPFTWFVYGNSANPKTYDEVYKPLLRTEYYNVYQFPKDNFPLFGLSQGVGVHHSFNRSRSAYADDILSGMKLIEEGGLIAYIPTAGIYHYHVANFSQFISKYKWRIRNNLTQTVKGMGISNRMFLLDSRKKLKIKLFIPYALSCIYPLRDAVKLSKTNNDIVMMYHPIVCLTLALIIMYEWINITLLRKTHLGAYK